MPIQSITGLFDKCNNICSIKNVYVLLLNNYYTLAQ